jgi:hypothetical protein
MQAVPFKWHRRAAMIAMLALAAAAALMLALMSNGAGPAQAAVHNAGKHRVHHARHHSAAREQAGGTDPDNVQSGDQTTPDNNVQSGDQSAPDTSGSAPGENTGAGESSVESEQGQPGEPANGHQDGGSNTANECTGNCVQ